MSEKPDMNIQTFAEQIAVEQVRHHEREKELLKLLRRCNEAMPICPCCKNSLKTWARIIYNETIRIGHAEDCELARELADVS